MYEYLVKRPIIIYYLSYIFGSIIVTIFTIRFLSLMLGFNVLLALLSILLIDYIYKKIFENNNELNYYTILMLIGWVFIFPNTFYVITDFIHIDYTMFYTSGSRYGSVLYLKDIIEYLSLIHIFVGALLGVFAGVYSLKVFIKIFENIGIEKMRINIIITGLFLLSSFGIYIGRFLRFSSWEIFKMKEIILTVFNEISVFMLLFILMFTFLQWILFLIFKMITKEFVKI